MTPLVFLLFFYCLSLLEPFGSRFIDVYLLQLKILNVDKTAFKWLLKQRDSKNQNKNTRWVIFISAIFVKKMEFRTYFFLFVYTFL